MPNPDADPNHDLLSHREDSDQSLSDVDIESRDDVEQAAATGFSAVSANTSDMTGRTDLGGHTEEKTEHIDQALGQTKSHERVKSTRPTELTGPTRRPELMLSTELVEEAGKRNRKVSPSPAKGGEMTNIYDNHPLVQGAEGGGGDDKDGARGKAGEKKMGLKRLETQEFREYREKEAREGGGGVGAGWNKMAIIRIHRPDKKPEPK